MIWVLGARGLLGSSLIRECARQGLVAVGSGREADVCDSAALEKLAAHLPHGPDWIINCAAYTNVDAAEGEPQKCFAVNEGGASMVARLARKFGAQLLHISTDYVFGGQSVGPFHPYREGEPCAPVNVYGSSKLAGERAVLREYPDATVLRTSWLYSFTGRNFLTRILQALADQDEVKVPEYQTGCPTWVEVLSSALVSGIIARGIRVSGVYHASCHGHATRFEFASAIAELAAGASWFTPRGRIVGDNSRTALSGAPRPGWSVLDSSQFDATFPFALPHWRDALEACFDAHAKEATP